MSDLIADFVRDLRAIDGLLIGHDEEIVASWNRLKERIVPPGCGGIPPVVDGGVGGEVNYLAWHLYKMALMGQTPLPDSLGVEQLLFRYTRATEAMTVMLERIVMGRQAQP